MPKFTDRTKATSEVATNLETLTLLRGILAELKQLNQGVAYLGQAAYAQSSAQPADRAPYPRG